MVLKNISYAKNIETSTDIENAPLELVSDKQRYQFIVERLCSQTALIS
jgi:hypothetical protein